MLLDFTVGEVLGQDIVCWILCVEKGKIANFGLHLPQHVIEKGFFSSKAVCLTLNCLTLCLWEKRDARAGNEWDSVVCGQTRTSGKSKIS